MASNRPNSWSFHLLERWNGGTIVGQIRGAAVQSVKNYVIGLHGQEGLQRVLDQLPSSVAGTFTHSLAISWVPSQHMEHFYRTASEVFGVDMETMSRELGRANADKDLPSYFKFILSKATPALVFAAVPTVWRSYYDTGKMTVHSGDRLVTATLVEFEDPGVLCWDTCGFAERLLELTGVKNPKVAHTHCVARGDSECVFEGTWD